MKPIYEPGTIISPDRLPVPLQVRYDLKLSQFGVKQGIGGLRYDGFEVVHYFTIMDEGAHSTLAVKDEELKWMQK